LERGKAALLLDGLDDCGGMRSRVAEGLAGVVHRLPEATPVVMSSRDSAAAAASKLGLPPTRMVEPRSLGRALDALLQHIAAHRIAQDKRERWLNERRQWLAAARDADTAVGQVPLLATLLTLLAGGDVRRPAPQRRAQLLAEVVWESVRRWETRRARERPDPPVPTLRPELLLDAYAEIGHLLSASVDVSEGEARRVVSASLRTGWGLAPAEAAAVAGDVLGFWDEEVGIFVVGGDGTVQPRTRLFAEIGDAMWAAEGDPATREAWLDRALIDEERRECVLLAAGLSPAIAEALAKRAVTVPVEGSGLLLLLAADAVADGASPSEPTLACLIDRLADAASSSSGPDGPAGQGGIDQVVARYAARRRKRDGEGWGYVLRLGRLQLPPALRSVRDAAIDQLSLDEEHTVVARAVAALADTRADKRHRLESREAERVGAMLALQLPTRDRQLVQRSRRFAEFVGEMVPLIQGHAEAAEEATAFVAQLGEDAAGRLYEIAKKAPLDTYERVAETLHRAGYSDPEPPLRSLTRFLGGLFEDPWSQWERFYELVAGLSEPDPLTLVEAWALPDLGTVVDTLEINEAGLGDIASAFTQDDPAFLATVVRVQAAATGISLGKLAAEARHAQTMHQVSPQRVVHLLLTPPAGPVPVNEPALSAADVDQLLACLAASSALTADFAFDRLAFTSDSRIGHRVRGMLPGLDPWRRRNAAFLACLLADDPAATAEELLDGDDGPTRAGAAAYLAWEAHRTGQDAPALARARTDLDLTVRRAARRKGAAGAETEVDEANGHNGPAATHWTCLDCAEVNAFEILDCSMCPTGARPGPHSFAD
jgi:hypothetical protein